MRNLGFVRLVALLPLSLLLWHHPVYGWAPVASSRGSIKRERQAPPPTFMMDPASVVAVVGDVDVALEVGVALMGAAAGAASQLPRVYALQGELALVRRQLNETEAGLVEKIHVLENKLFEMDAEFEEQTAKFQRQYDQTQKQRLADIKDKLKTEMQYKLEIQLARQKSEKLMESVTLEHGRTGKQEELSQLKLRSIRLEDLNAELEATLKQTDKELQHLREVAAKKKSFLFW